MKFNPKSVASFIEILLHAMKDLFDAVSSRGGQMVLLGSITLVAGAFYLHSQANGPAEKIFIFFSGLFSRTLADGGAANGVRTMPFVYDKKHDESEDGPSK